MPLIKSPSKEALGKNISKLTDEGGRPRDQILAISLETQRRAGGGKKRKMRGMGSKGPTSFMSKVQR